jgi:hypothetical protein
MKVSQCQLIIIGDDGVNMISLMDVIEHAGKFWLVPDWIDMPVQKGTKPLRIISLETMAYDRMVGSNPEFLVENPVPSYIFEGRIPPAEAGKYVVVEGPDILIPRDAKLH